jgi:H+/Cl- antiporter ClcA
VGASIMQTLGRALRLPRLETQRGLILAGGAAGIAAAFNTPLAGIVFAIEELAHSFEARTSGIVLTAVIIAGIATLALSGNYTYFGVTSVGLHLGTSWVAVLVCAAAGGTLGGGFSRILLAVPHGLPGRLGRAVRAHPIVFAAICGLAIAVIGLVSKGATYGTGYAQARALVEGEARLPASFFILKFLASAASYLSGIPGGIFAPSLAVGASMGSWLAHFFPDTPARAIVLLGMVAYFSGVVQAPITAFVIVLEMTANQQMTIPIMATSLLALGFSRLVCRRPLYGTLAVRFLRETEVAVEKRD